MRSGRAAAVAAALTIVAAGCGSGAADGEASSTAVVTSVATTMAGAPTSTSAEPPFLFEPVDLDVEVEPVALPPDPWSLFVYFSDGTLRRFDPQTAEVTGEATTVPASAMAYGLDAVWLASCDDGTVTRVGAESLEIEGTWDLGGCASQLAFTEGFVLALLADDGAVVMLDPSDGTVATIYESQGMTVLDAGSPAVVGTSSGGIALLDVHAGGTVDPKWAAHWAGRVVAADVDERGGFVSALVQPDHGNAFLVKMNLADGTMLDSYDPSIGDANVFVRAARWFFSWGPGGRFYTIDTRDGEVDEFTGPDPVDAAGTASGGDPAVAVLSDDGSATSAAVLTPGDGDAGSVMYELGPSGGHYLASRPPPGPCELDEEVRVARLQAEQSLATIVESDRRVRQMAVALDAVAQAIVTRSADVGGDARAALLAAHDDILGFDETTDFSHLMDPSYAAHLRNLTLDECDPEALARINDSLADAVSDYDSAIGAFRALFEMVDGHLADYNGAVVG